MLWNDMISLLNSPGILNHKAICVQNALDWDLNAIITMRNCIDNCLINSYWRQFRFINKATVWSALLINLKKNYGKTLPT